VLVDHPDSAALRIAEFDVLVKLRKKREARKTRDRFKEDFPYLTNRIEMMDLQLDASAGKTKRVSEKLREYAQNSYGLGNKKDIAIAHHRIEDIFRARRLMDEVHPEFANDAELNAAMASNYFQLARPAKARKYARLALAADPTNRRMSFLIKTSWLIYFPLFYFMTVFMLLFYSLDALLGRLAAWLIVLPLAYIFADFFNIFKDALFILLGTEPPLADALLVLGWFTVYLAATAPSVYSFIFRRSKTVSLKKY
jgi:tetratricopeptide (TPR) repeat protein